MSDKPKYTTFAQSPKKNNDKRPSRPAWKRSGVWAEVEGGKFRDPDSQLGVIVTERVRGKPAYSFTFVHMDEKGTNKFLPFPVQGKFDVEHVMFSLAKKAREFIEEKMKENKMSMPRTRRVKTEERSS